MAIELHKKQVQQEITELLVGSSINRVSYYVTGWELRVISTTGVEHNISASEIEVPGTEDWWASLIEPSFSLADTNESKDTMAAIAIFTVLNRWPISSTLLDEQSNFYIRFENECTLKLLAVVGQLDWTWSISDDQNAAIFTCASGVLYKNI